MYSRNRFTRLPNGWEIDLSMVGGFRPPQQVTATDIGWDGTITTKHTGKYEVKFILQGVEQRCEFQDERYAWDFCRKLTDG